MSDATLLGMGGMGLAVLVFVALLLLVLWFWWSASRRRLRFGAAALSYSTAITVEEARRLGEHLTKCGVLSSFKYSLLDRTMGTYQITVFQFGRVPTERHLFALEVIAAGIADDVFRGAPVEIRVRSSFAGKPHVVAHRGRFGRRLVMNASELFFMEGVTHQEAFMVAMFLAAKDVFNQEPKFAQMNRKGEGFEFRLAVSVDPLPYAMMEGASRMAGDLSRGALAGAPVTVEYAKGFAGALRVRETAGGAADAAPEGGPYHTEDYSWHGPPGESLRAHLK